MTRDLFSSPTLATAEAVLVERFEAYVAHRAQSRSRAKAVRPLREESAAMYRAGYLGQLCSLLCASGNSA